MRVGGQSSLSPSHLPTDSLRSVYSSFIHSFIHSAISIAPLQVLYHSEALPTTSRILYRSFMPKRSFTPSSQLIVELARGRRWSRNLEPNFSPGRDLNSEPD